MEVGTCWSGWSGAQPNDRCLPLSIFPCTIKSRNSLLAPAHLGGPGKRAIKQLWWCGVRLKWRILVNSKIWGRQFVLASPTPNSGELLPLVSPTICDRDTDSLAEVSFCSRNIFSTKPRGWLGRTSLKSAMFYVELDVKA